MFCQHVVDVPVLPKGAPADEVVAAGIGPGELAQLFLPLPLQARQPNAVARCVLRQIPLGWREHLLASVDEVIERLALRKRRDGVPCRVPPVG
jgi:hypothetical protein